MSDKLWFEPVECAETIRWNIPVMDADAGLYWAAQNPNSGTWTLNSENSSLAGSILSDNDFRNTYFLDVDQCRTVAREARLFSANITNLLNEGNGAVEDVAKYMRNAEATGHFSACAMELAEFFEENGRWPSATLKGFQRVDDTLQDLLMLNNLDMNGDNHSVIDVDIDNTKSISIPEDCVVMAMFCMSPIDGEDHDMLLDRAIDALLQTGNFTDGIPVLNSSFQNRMRKNSHIQSIALPHDVDCVRVAIAGAKDIGLMLNEGKPEQENTPTLSTPNKVVPMIRKRALL